MQQSARPAAAALLELGIAIIRLARAHAARTRPAGLTLAELRALSLVDSAPGLLLKDLAALMGLTPATVSRLAARLVRRGLLRRSADRGDRRAANFRVSRQGAAALRRSRRAIETVLEARLTGLEAGERAALLRLVRRTLPALASTGRLVR